MIFGKRGQPDLFYFAAVRGPATQKISAFSATSVLQACEV
jgi:hypothetical protein